MAARSSVTLAEWGPIGLRVIDDEEFQARARLRRDADATAYVASLDHAGRSVAAQLALSLLRDQDSPVEGSAALLAQVVAGVDGAVGTNADAELPTE